MSYAYDPKELDFTERTMSFNPAVPGTPLFKFPVSIREAYESLLVKKDPVWMPYGVETGFFAPSVIPDNIARGFVFEAKPWPVPYDRHKDMFGIEWIYVPVAGGSMEDPDHARLLEDANDWKENLTFPDVDSWDWDASARLNNDYLKNNGKANLLWLLNGAGFERLISFFGFENAALALVDEDQEDAMHELLSALTDLYIKIIDRCVETYGEGLSGFDYHDDWGSQKSPFFSEDAAQTFFVPEWKRLTSHIKSKGKIAELHSCGHIEDRIQCIVDGGWDNWAPMPMNATQKLYREYGDKIMIAVCPDKPADDTFEAQYEAGKKFAEKFFERGKVACFSSFYAGFPMSDGFAKGMYEVSRQKAAK